MQISSWIGKAAMCAALCVAASVADAQTNVARTGRFTRGTGTNVHYHSFVIPLSHQAGVPYDLSGGNATNIYPNNPWTFNRYHYNGTNTGVQHWVPGVSGSQQPFRTNRIAFKNPIVAFGSASGGTPLFSGNAYAFGVYAGDPYPWPEFFADAIRIQVYWRTNFASAGSIYVPVPLIVATNGLNEFATNGFTLTTNAFGLNTVISDHPYPDWNVDQKFTYALTHTASDAATNYIYEVTYAGYGDEDGTNALVLNSSGSDHWSRLYTLDFEARDALRPRFIDQPHFDIHPLPSEYLGKSLAELTNIVAAMPGLTSLNHSNFLALGHSPELRAHPILDQFVADMRNDPLALANYVANEIGLTDMLDYDVSQNSQPVINPGGVNRSALATFQEGQGSPTEQCALLVYLLRRAGVPAAYLYPTNGGLMMLDRQMSKLLGMQLKGAVNYYATEEFIPYPLQNLAAGKVAEQSSTANGGAAARAVDGNTDGTWSNNSVTHTDYETSPWWQVDLGVSVPIGEIEIWNREDCCGDRLSNFYVMVSDQPFGSASLSTLTNDARFWWQFHSGEASASETITANRVGRYVRVQLSGANYLSLAEVKVLSNPDLGVIGVNYPWVGAYVGNEWVHVFPWIKDTEIIEGLNVYDYMPTNYNSGYKWVSKYLSGDTNILSLSASDQVSDLFPRFIQQGLNANHPGLSVDDLGVRRVNRRHLRADWESFPKPFSLSGTPAVVENLNTLTEMFDTVQIRVYSAANTNKFIDTGELRVADIHNRKVQLRYHRVGSQNVHDMVLSLGSYSPAITNIAAFGTTNLTWRLMQTNQLNSSDDEIRFQVTHRRLRYLPGSFQIPDPLTNQWQYAYAKGGFTMISTGMVFQREFRYKKGDLLTFCLSLGQVSERMLNVHAEEIWRFERNADTNNAATLDADVYQGTTTYLMGMSYYHQDSRFRRFCEDLHKVRILSNFDYGFALLKAKRDGSGQLVDGGKVILTTPTVDIPEFGLGTIFNGTLRPDSGRDFFSASRDCFLVRVAQGSAGEHGIIRSFYNTNAVSTVKLLQTAGDDILWLDKFNWQAHGDAVYDGTPLKLHDPGLWAAVEEWFTNDNLIVQLHRQALITPGNVTHGAYTGMGAFLVDFATLGALITGNLSGGESYPLPDVTFSLENAINLAVVANQPGALSPLRLLTASDAGINPVFSAPASWHQEQTYNLISLNQLVIDPLMYFSTTQANVLNGTISGSAADGFQMVYNQGLLGTFLSVSLDSFAYVSDPVNVITGEFYVDAPDLTLPGPMPLSVRRNYSSLNVAENQFGFGWRLNYMPFLTVGEDGAVLYAAEPDGTMIAYQRTATNNNVWLPTREYNPQLANKTTAGIGSIFNPFNGRIERSVNTYTMSSPDGSVRTFVERTFPLGGTFTRLRPYLTRWEDHRGNAYEFEYGEDSSQPDYGQVRRIQSSNGNFLGFYYDVFGHVVEAYTGDGRRLVYEYDSYGDLVRVTFPDASQIQYEYEHATFVTNNVTHAYSTHLLAREVKPDGRLLVNEYDEHRRVTNQLATVGVDLVPVRNGTFIYANDFNLTNSYTNTITGHTIVKDVFNHELRYDYTNGLITKITDALNQTEEQVWYADDAVAPGYPRSLWKRKDKRGLWTEFKYDPFGNVTNSVTWGDLTGDGTTQYATNSIVYNANNLPGEATDAAGNKTVTIYSEEFPFLAEQIILHAGQTPTVTNRLSYGSVTNTFESGGVTYTNLARGLLQQSIRAYNSSDAATNQVAFDGRGYPIEQIQFTGTSDPAMTNWFVYNARGELVETMDAAGRRTVFSHDAMGRPTMREVYEAGATVPLAWEYSYHNENGELTWSDGPRYDPEDYVWRDQDGAGRPMTEIRWRSQAKEDGSGVEAVPGYDLFATTWHEHDGFGNNVKSVDARGNYVLRSFDALGQKTKEILYAANGIALSTNSAAYEPGGRVTLETNALGGVTETLYTATGQPKFRRNPDGSTNGWTYYLDGRPHREYLSNGSYGETTYDDANRTVTRVFHSAASAPLATNVTFLDRRGNVIVQTDAEGFSRTNHWDGVDRLKWHAGVGIVVTNSTSVPTPSEDTEPVFVQQASTNYYGVAGTVVTNVNGLGEKTIIWSDALGRTTRTESRAANNTLVRESTVAYAPDHHSQTMTNGSGSSAIVSTVYTDNTGNDVLSLSYPAASVKHFTRTERDAVGNPLFTARYARTNSTQTLFSYAASEYNGLNQRTRQEDRDGAVTTFQHGPLGHLLERVVPGGLVFRAKVNSAGQVYTNWLASAGGAVVQANGFTFYGSGHPWAGLPATHIDARGVTGASSYDEWLRRATNAYTGTLPEENLTLSWIYDLLGRPTEIAQRFASTNTGPDVVIGRSYNPYDQLTSERVSIGGIPHWSGNSFNAAGRRGGINAAGFTYGFKWRADGLLEAVDVPGGKASYYYTTAGFMTNRVADTRNSKITSRDGAGLPLEIETRVNGVLRTTETLAYTGDNLLSAHTVDRTSTGFTDARRYTYAPLSRYLIQEELGIDAFNTWTNVFQIDSGAAAGPGVLTGILEPGTGAEWSAHLDAHLRIDRETNNVVRRLAHGRVNMPLGNALLSVLFNDRPIPFLSMSHSETNWPTRWQAQIELTPGVHTLTATATHPSRMFTNTTTVTFTNNAVDQTVITYYSAGHTRVRVWINSAGQTNRVETYDWDALDRMIRFTERDINGNGHDWRAVYDAFHRKLQTVKVPVTNDVAFATEIKVTTHVYDPLFEFMELGVHVAPDGLGDGGKWHWKVYGPDLNGTYGGLNGVGGWDAVVTGANAYYPFVPDARGNILGAFDAESGSVQWNQSRVTGYGSIPEHRPRSLGEGVSLWDSGAWQGRFPEFSGDYVIGRRVYRPIGAYWLSPDPIFDPANPNGRSFAGLDPINFTDADGRVAAATKNFVEGTVSGLAHLANNGLSAVGYGMTSYFSPGLAENWYGTGAQGFADNLGSIGQSYYDLAATASYAPVSMIDPDGAYQAYGPSVERVASGFVGGEGHSTTYQATYATISTIGLVFGGGTRNAVNSVARGTPPVNVLPSSGSRFVVSPGGDAIIVPHGATGPVPNINQGGRTTGFGYTGGSGGPGLDPRVSNVRIMDATAPRGPSPGYPAGYVNYQNASGQSVNPFTGQTIAPNNPLWHIPLTPP